VDKSVLERILRYTQRLDRTVGQKGWTADYLDVREELNRLLFGDPNNRRLHVGVSTARAMAGGIQNTRLRFIVSEKTHPIPLEAFKDPDHNATKSMDREPLDNKASAEDHENWMGKFPIYRRYDMLLGSRFPLFKDRASRRGPVNCLLIEANPEKAACPPRGIPNSRSFPGCAWRSTPCATC
jgi:hypothetical protein